MGVHRHGETDRVRRIGKGALLAAVLIALLLPAGRAFGVAGNIGNTKHNLSATGGGYPIQNIHASDPTQTEICIFCHTPHRALSAGPLWNHSMSSIVSYTLYTSTTLLSPLPTGSKPDGDSLLCLSCHDGDQPIGALQNVGGTSTIVSMTGTNQSGGKLIGPSSFGSDLSGHHPISIEMSNCLAANKQTECATPPGPVSWKLATAVDPAFLKPTANRYNPPGGAYTCAPVDHPGTGVQCSSCHDAHTSNWMFLRVPTSLDPWGNRTYSDTLCTTCHVACP